MTAARRHVPRRRHVAATFHVAAGLPPVALGDDAGRPVTVLPDRGGWTVTVRWTAPPTRAQELWSVDLVLRPAGGGPAVRRHGTVVRDGAVTSQVVLPDAGDGTSPVPEGVYRAAATVQRRAAGPLAAGFADLGLVHVGRPARDVAGHA